MRRLQRIWNEIRRGENIELYLSVIIAIALAAFSLLGIASQEWIAPLTVTILAFLAVGHLNTRYAIEKQIQNLTSNTSSGLRGRTELPSFRKEGQTSNEIVIVGISLISAVVPNIDFFEKKLQKGCHLRFLLLDPASPSVQTWNTLGRVHTVQHDIEQTLNFLAILTQSGQASSGVCEVRLSPVFLPFGITAFDPSREEGLMNVEMFAYKRLPGDRPHVLLRKSDDKKWFEFFSEQYEQLWVDSKPWKATVN